MSIEKEVFAFFKNLLKEFEEKIELSGDQTTGKFRSAIGSETSEKFEAFKIEIEELCQQKKEELSDVAYSLSEKIRCGNFDNKKKELPTRRKWLWFLNK
jgi:hypothetical protein